MAFEENSWTQARIMGGGRCWWEDERIVVCEGKIKGATRSLFSYHFWNSAPTTSHAPLLYWELLGPVPPFYLPAM